MHTAVVKVLSLRLCRVPADGQLASRKAAAIVSRALQAEVDQMTVR